MEISVSAKYLKDTAVCLAWWGTRILPQGCTIVRLDSLFLPSLFILTFPSQQMFESAPWNSRRIAYGGWIKPILCNQRNEGHWKACVHRSHTEYFLVSLRLLIIRVLMSEKSTSYCIWYWYHNNNRNGVSKLLQINLNRKSVHNGFEIKPFSISRNSSGHLW